MSSESIVDIEALNARNDRPSEVDGIKAEYRKLGDVQKRDIDKGVQEVINGIETMRGINDDAASPIHARLNGIFAFLVELQEAGWEADEEEEA